MRRAKPLQLLIGAAIAVLLVVPLGALAFIKSGIYDVGAAKPHTKLTEWMTHETMVQSVRRHARGIAEPDGFTAGQVARGLCQYARHCAACHGAAAIARDSWASGMEPAPPYLLDAAEKWRPRELFWIAKNGIKMTGMPSWRAELSDPEIWDVVAWLEANRQLPPQTFARWRAGRACPR